MEFKVLILGSNSALPAHGRHPSSQFLTVHNNHYLIDCGEGTQMQLDRYDARKSRINQIFITHLHGDHYFGIFGLLTTYNLLRRSFPLQVFGPVGLSKMISTVLDSTGNSLNYSLEVIEIEADEPQMIFEDSEVRVLTFPLKHRIPTYGYLFEEKRPSVKLNGHLLDKYKVPLDFRESIRAGKSFTSTDGTVFPASIFFEKTIEAGKFAYCSDTAPFPLLEEYVQGVDLLYHEATFLSVEKDRAELTQHSTAAQAAMTALRAGVGKLLIGHFSSRYKNLTPFKKEASAIFENTHLVEEGKDYFLD